MKEFLLILFVLMIAYMLIYYESKISKLRLENITAKQLNKELGHIARMDLMTNTYKHDEIKNAIELLIQNNERFSILFFDIDNFKRINDTFGHLTGDKCISDLADIVKGNIRKNDILGRYGGDEFLLILPDTNIEDSINIAKKINKKIEENTQPQFTISIGLAAYNGENINVDKLIKNADDGLYIAKKKGKNTYGIKHIDSIC